MSITSDLLRANRMMRDHGIEPALIKMKRAHAVELARDCGLMDKYVPLFVRGEDTMLMFDGVRVEIVE